MLDEDVTCICVSLLCCKVQGIHVVHCCSLQICLGCQKSLHNICLRNIACFVPKNAAKKDTCTCFFKFSVKRQVFSRGFADILVTLSSIKSSFLWGHVNDLVESKSYCGAKSNTWPAHAAIWSAVLECLSLPSTFWPCASRLITLAASPTLQSYELRYKTTVELEISSNLYEEGQRGSVVPCCFVQGFHFSSDASHLLSMRGKPRHASAFQDQALRRYDSRSDCKVFKQREMLVKVVALQLQALLLLTSIRELLCRLRTYRPSTWPLKLTEVRLTGKEIRIYERKGNLRDADSSRWWSGRDWRATWFATRIRAITSLSQQPLQLAEITNQVLIVRFTVALVLCWSGQRDTYELCKKLPEDNKDT